LQFGLMYFNSGAPSLGVWNRDFFDSLEQAVLADRVGFNSVLVSEHHFTEQGYTTSPNIVCGMLAARTGNVRIGPGVALLPLHHPVALAEEAALLDRMSNGRYIMGVGLGYRREEFEGYNISLKEGSSRLEEGIKIIDLLLSQEKVSFDGQYYHLREVNLTPRPIQKPRPPIWVGAKAEAPVRRAARLGDVWFMDPVTPLKVLKERMSMYEEELRRAGKEPAVEKPLRREAYVANDNETAWKEGGDKILQKWHNYFVWGHVQDEDGKLLDPEEHDFDVMKEMMRRRYVVGDPDAVIEQAERYQKELGATQLVFQLQFPGLTHEKAMNAIRLIGERVIPYFRDQSK